MKNIPKNWQLAEEYDGNFIYEDNGNEFQVTIDETQKLSPPYSVSFQQLKGTFTKISFESGAYATHAYNEEEAKQKAYKMMVFITLSSLFYNKIQISYF